MAVLKYVQIPSYNILVLNHLKNILQKNHLKNILQKMISGLIEKFSYMGQLQILTMILSKFIFDMNS